MRDVRKRAKRLPTVGHMGKPVDSRLIDVIRLDNGLFLEMYDLSRHVVGDRWLVSFEARIDVEVKPEYFSGKDSPGLSFEDIRSQVGERVTYCYEKVRNLIVDIQKDEVLAGLKERFLSTNFDYLSSPDFPRKLIIRKYKDRLSPAKVWKTH